MIEAALPELELREVTFDGSLTFDSTGTLIREKKKGEPEWVGEPTPEMDAMWDRVARDGRVFPISTEIRSGFSRVRSPDLLLMNSV